MLAFKNHMIRPIYTFVAFDDATITAFNFVTQEADTIDHIKQKLLKYKMVNVPQQDNLIGIEGGITMCDTQGLRARDLVSIFESEVMHEKVTLDSPIGPYDEQCLKEIQKFNLKGSSYKLSTIGEPGDFCSPQIIAKLVGHGQVVISGQSSSLRMAVKNVKVKGSKPQYVVNADEALGALAFDEEVLYVGWLLGRHDRFNKIILRYVDKRPVIVLYPNSLITAYVVAGIEPYLSDVGKIHEIITALPNPEFIFTRPIEISRYTVGKYIE